MLSASHADEASPAAFVPDDAAVLFGGLSLELFAKGVNV